MPTHFRPLGTEHDDSGDLRVFAPDGRLTRTHFFDGRLLTARDLTREQTYLDRRLRDVGLAGGDGVVAGLELSFDRERLALVVSAGVGVTRAGRALALDDDLEVDLGDRAGIQGLNGGVALFTASVYAVVLVYAETESAEVAEVFPSDLGAERGSKSDATVEGAEVVLVPLVTSLGVGDELGARRQLADELIARDGLGLPADGVALGVLAFDKDVPTWIDAELLRHPLRVPGDPLAHEDDLRRHYEALLSDVEARRDGGRFAASAYFHRIPSFGRAPKAAFDPAAGTQRWLRADDDVTISIVRADELAVVAEESRPLAAIDLRTDGPASVLVMAVVPAERYAEFAEALERDSGDDGLPEPGEPLPHLRARRLRPRSNGLDTDAATWTSIWDAIGPDDVYYVRRVPRPASTPASGILVAAGATSADGPTVRQLRDRLASARDETTALQQALDDALEKLDAAEAQARALRDELEAARDEAAEAGDGRGDLEEALERAEQRAREAAARIAELEAKLDQASRGVEEEKAKRREFEVLVAARDASLRETNEEVEKQKTELRELRTAKANFENELAEAVRKAREHREDELDELGAQTKREIEELKAKAGQLEERLDATKGELGAAVSKRDEFAARVAALDDAMRAKDAEIQGALKKVSELERARVEAAQGHRDELLDAERKHATVLEKLNTKHAAEVGKLNKTYESTVAKLRNELDELRGRR